MTSLSLMYCISLLVTIVFTGKLSEIQLKYLNICFYLKSLSLFHICHSEQSYLFDVIDL